MSCYVLKLIKLKNKLRQKCHKHPSNLKLKKRFKKLCKKVKCETKSWRDKYFHNKFQNALGNSRKEWEVINCITNRKTKDKSNSIVLSIDGQDIVDQSLVANIFNDFFVSVGEKSSAMVDNNVCLMHSDIVESTYFSRSFSFEPITGSEILNLIYSLDNSNSVGFDNVSNQTLKKLRLILSIYWFIFLI